MRLIDLVIWFIYFFIGAFTMEYVMVDSMENKIKYYQDQITIRDTVNTKNIRVHKQDSARLQWFFDHNKR